MIRTISEKKECPGENLFSGSTSVTHTTRTAFPADRAEHPVFFVRGTVLEKHGRALRR